MEQILIVDDLPANIKILGEILRKKYQLLVANNGEKALQVVQKKQPDLVLMDVMMPGMDGFTVCKKLKENPKTAQIPIIFITALNKQEDIIKGFEAGGQDYITKPFHPVELFLRIQTHLELCNSRIQIQCYARELESKNKELSEAMEKLKKMATMDPLTNLLNRRSMLEKIQEEVSRCKRYGGFFSLAIADIDDFKTINDTYGHNCGDLVLKQISSLIQDHVRTTDMVSRWGGEEFLLLFPETRLEKGKEACEKVRRILETHTIPYEEEEISVTITLGLTESRMDLDITAIIKQADEALYQGKKAGKNTVIENCQENLGTCPEDELVK